MWTIFAWLAKVSGWRATRSENRQPTAISKSHSLQATLLAWEPCMPIMPVVRGCPPREAAPAHDGDGHRGVQLFGEDLELRVRPPPDHAAAADEHGLFRLGDHVYQGVDIPDVGLRGL